MDSTIQESKVRDFAFRIRICVVSFPSVSYSLSASYLSDLWIFDTETYKWKEVELKATDRIPGFVFHSDRNR